MGFRYIGSKVRIAREIMAYISGPNNESSYFLDAFAGTGTVASVAADLGWNVHVNDILKSATAIAVSRLLSENEVPFSGVGGYRTACEKLNNIRFNGFFWKEYSPASLQSIGIERRYFTEDNARLLDGARRKIFRWFKTGAITLNEKILLLATVISAMNKVANIAGTYGCFISHWMPQSQMKLNIKPLRLRSVAVPFSFSNLDVFDSVASFDGTIYLDPPYTKRQYASYYHIMETLVSGDEPSVVGVSGLRPWKDKASLFCYKSKALDALVSLIGNAKARRVFLSYSDEGHVALKDLEEKLSLFGRVEIIPLGEIGRYRPNAIACSNRDSVNEYLIDFKRGR